MVLFGPNNKGICFRNLGSDLTLSEFEIEAIVNGTYSDPFALLGLHKSDTISTKSILARAFVPGAMTLEAFTLKGKSLGFLRPIHQNGLFEGELKLKDRQPISYSARSGDTEWFITDPYSFNPVLGPIDDYLVNEGSHKQLFDIMGAHFLRHQSVDGVNFVIWAPNASLVSLVGDFNDWDPKRHVMRKRFDTGIWEIFIPNIGAGRAYKFHIKTANGEILPLKSDPFAFKSELRPATASITTMPLAHKWKDKKHQEFWKNANFSSQPISIYEVHAGSWQRGFNGEFLTWDQLSDTLIPYVLDMGFTHIEFMPISEHPLDESWGYQALGLFSPSARFGEPEGLARFVDNAHKAGISVLIDWVPAHFPTDEHGLGRFDGTALYEHEDPRLGFHPDWTTFIYNFSRTEVMSFLINNALYWTQKYHIDGLRVDAVASMLYRDYSRKAGEWLPNNDGGRENWEAVNFLRRVNSEVHAADNGAFTVAEESTSWPGVSHSIENGGLGFNFKWNMGFMNDTLRYMARDPMYRTYHHDEITFGLVYAFNEAFVLPLSHDEVVHGKGSLLNKMPGDNWRKHANLRAYYAFMWAYPGKKLLFMGQEFAQSREWAQNRALDWFHLEDGLHIGCQKLVRDLNRVYRNSPALYLTDCDGAGFEWAIVDDRKNSVFAWIRRASDAPIIAVVCNFGGEQLFDYEIPLPNDGFWCELINTDAQVYGGSGNGNHGGALCINGKIKLTLPALSTILLEYKI